MRLHCLWLALLLSACASVTPPPPTATQAPPSPTPVILQTFRDQIDTLIEEGRTLDDLTAQGVQYETYGQQLLAAKAAFEKVEASWPVGYAPKVRYNFTQAIRGWELALALWSAEILEKSNPMEPNINGYSDYMNYAGDYLNVRAFPADYEVEDYRGKQYIPYSDNVGILLAVASQFFINARGEIRARLP
jgi:hypothetical protein